MSPRSIWSRIAAIAAVLALAACGNAANKSETKKVKLAFVANAPADFWTLVRKGTEAAGKELDNVDVKFQVADGTAGDQSRIVDELMMSGFAGIAISPVDSVSQTPMINTIAQKSIVITQDNDAPESNRLAFIGTDHVAAGQQAGDLIKEALPTGGKIMLFVGRKNELHTRERLQGIQQAIASTDIQILDVKADDGDLVRAKANVADAIMKYPDITALIGVSVYNGPAILSALREAKKLGKIRVVCFDDDPATIGGIMDGSVYGMIVQQPYEIGYQAIKLMNSILAGDKSDIPASKQRFIPTLAVTKAIVNEYADRIDKLRGE